MQVYAMMMVMLNAVLHLIYPAMIHSCHDGDDGKSDIVTVGGVDDTNDDDDDGDDGSIVRISVVLAYDS
jgi:hypothetical protein